MDPAFKFVVPAPDVVWRSSIEAGALVYLVGTSLEFVTPGSPREEDLSASGMLCVGMLRFDRDLKERTHPGRRVRVLDERSVVCHLGAAPSRN